MGVLKNGVGRPSNETIRKRNILKVVCVILVVIIIGLICYILNDKGIIKVSNDNKKVTEKNKKKEEISKEEALKVVKDVLGNIDEYLTNGDMESFNDDSTKTLIAIASTKKTNKKYDICSLYECNDKIVYDKTFDNDFDEDYVSGNLIGIYDYNDVEKTFNKLFKTGSTIKKDSFSGSNLFEEVLYNKDKNLYFRFFISTDGASSYIKGIYNAYISNNKLHVIYAASYYDPYESLLYLDNGEKVSIEINEEGNLVYSNDELFNKYKDKMTKYDFSFEKTKDGYKFIKSSKLK